MRGTALRGLNTAELVDAMVFHFGAVEAAESLRSDNVGDARRWMEVAAILIGDDRVAIHLVHL